MTKHEQTTYSPKAGKKSVHLSPRVSYHHQRPLPELVQGNNDQVLCWANTQVRADPLRPHQGCCMPPAPCPSTLTPGYGGSWVWSISFSILPATCPPETSVLPDLLLSAALAEGGPRQGGQRGALSLLRNDQDSQGPGATVFPSAPYRTCPLPSKGTCGVWKHSCVLKAPSAPWWKLPTQRLNFPLLFYKEQNLLLKSPNKVLPSQTQTLTPKCLVLLGLLSQFTH